MAQFVLLTDVQRAMSEFAPPAWCKLAIIGALSTSRIELWVGSGFFRAYLPPYNLWDEKAERKPTEIRLLRRGESSAELIERYGLNVPVLPNTEAIEVWREDWTEPQRVALGWHMFTEPWDWDRPAIEYEFFEIPRDYELLFGYDDLHPEGEPDLGLTYDAKFEDLCVEVESAEQLAPMVAWDSFAFGRKTISPTRQIGGPKGTGFQSADEPLVQQMLADWKADKKLTGSYLAEKYVDQAAGHGTRGSKIKRLQRRMRDYGI